MALFNPLTDHPVLLDNVVMLHFWSIVVGIAAASFIFWLFGRKPKSANTSVNSQKKLVPHTDDHDRFHSDIQNLQMAPEDLEIGPILGAGTFGQVFRGRWKGTNVAVKILSHGVAGAVSNIAVAREKMIGLASVHPNVVAVYAVLTEEPQRRFSICEPFAAEGSSLKTSIVMELCDRGSLLNNREKIWTVMKQDYQKGLVWVLKCLLEIVFGMEYLHSIGVVHGDLKCSNVMCTSKMSDTRGFVCKIADFGLARTSEGTTEMHSSCPGTALFAAPELLSSGSLGNHSDVYSFGMVAWHLISMGSMVADLEEYQVRYQVVEKGWRPPFPHQTPEFMQVLISRSWVDDRDHRPTFMEIRSTLTTYLHAVKGE